MRMLISIAILCCTMITPLAFNTPIVPNYRDAAMSGVGVSILWGETDGKLIRLPAPSSSIGWGTSRYPTIKIHPWDGPPYNGDKAKYCQQTYNPEVCPHQN